ncbi:MAG: hypothetical protein LBG96_02790 [Tannerella sp.]|jgi:L-arabinose isomerase|nr:hypothetical protein [Tannerella sp.]
MRAGIFGVGSDACWGQFPGLLERLNGYRQEIAKRMSAFGVEVTDAALGPRREQGAYPRRS